MTINGPAVILFCFYVAAAEKQGVSSKQLRGTVQNDILKEYMAQHAWCYPIEPALRLIVDLFEWGAEHAPQWNTISISGYHIREAGATAAQELAFTLANGFTYVERGMARGLDVDRFAPRLSHFFDIHNDFFEEIAKLRAARRIWARHMKERYGAKDPRSWMLRFHSQTAGVTLTAQQPMNNIVRVAYQALAAVLGGTQSLHTNSMDETLALPSEEAVMVALRTQQILAEESGVASMIDPLAGSYAVEGLTSKIEREALAYIERIDEMGGIIRAIEQGYPQKEISEAAYRFQRAFDRGDKVMVGANKYQVPEERPIPILKIDPDIERKQADRVRAWKKARDGAEARDATRRVREACENGENVMPPILAAVKKGVTVGEISDVFRQTFGEYCDPAWV
jgi:methylmalonyl-CoA mutase N-terminal domain/subunit